MDLSFKTLRYCRMCISSMIIDEFSILDAEMLEYKNTNRCMPLCHCSVGDKDISMPFVKYVHRQ